MTPIFLRITLATLAAYFGGILGAWLGPRIAARHMQTLVFAAMGALLAVTLFDVLPEAKELLSWPVFLIAVVTGYALFWAISRYVYHICPACAYSEFDEEASKKLQSTVTLLMIALAIHSTIDGLAVVVGDEMRGRADLGLLFGVSFHKIPEGMALATLLLSVGYRSRSALLWTMLIESTTEIGGLIGIYSLHHVSLVAMGVLFAHVGGGFIYLGASALGIANSAPGSKSPRDLARPLAMSGGLAFALTAGLLTAVRRFAP